MSIYKSLGCSTAVMAGVMLTWVAPTKAFLYPVAPAATSYIQHVDCAAGFHVGPVGTCVIGTDEPHDRVMERRDKLRTYPRPPSKKARAPRGALIIPGLLYSRASFARFALANQLPGVR
jgi:hypothetical protein